MKPALSLSTAIPHAALLAIVLAAGSAQGLQPALESKQTPQPAAIHSDMAVRSSLAAAAAQPAAPAAAREVMVFTQSCEQGVCEVRVEDGRVFAVLNGQPVPQRRILRDEQNIRVMTDDGREVMIVRTHPGGASAVPPAIVTGRQAPAAPQTRILRHIQPRVTVAPTPAPNPAQATGQPPHVIRRIIRGQDAPAARGAGNPRVGQLIIRSGDGQERVIDLGATGGGAAGAPRSFQVVPSTPPAVRGTPAPGRVTGRAVIRSADGQEHIVEIAPSTPGPRFQMIPLNVLPAQPGQGQQHLQYQLAPQIRAAITGAPGDATFAIDLSEVTGATGIAGEWVAALSGNLAGIADATRTFTLAPAAGTMMRTLQPSAGGGSGGGSGGAAAAPPSRANVAARGGSADAQPPRVMIGITMSEAGPDLLEQLGLEPGSGIRVESVFPGLPADRSGLKPGAVIVAIDGQSPATTTALRSRLGRRSPGDAIVLDVVTRGQRRQVTLELDPYNQQLLEAAAQSTPGPSPSTVSLFGNVAQTDNSPEALSSRISEAVAALSALEVSRIDHDALRLRIEAIVRDQLGRTGNFYTDSTPISPEAFAQRMFVAPRGPATAEQMILVEPTQPAISVERRAAPGAGPDIDRRLNDLSDRLTRLEQRLDQLMQTLERRPRE